MKPIMFLFRGMPGSGKSTLLKKYNLESNVVSLDSFREMFSGVSLTEDGLYGIDQKYNGYIIKFYKEALRTRLREQALLIVDNLNLARKDFKDTVKMAQEYGYDVKVVDFELHNLYFYLKRNESREERKRLPISAIERLHKAFKETDTSNFELEIISVSDFEKYMELKTEDFAIQLDFYEAVNVIGALQGDYETFLSSNTNIQKNEFYIFLGNYFKGKDEYLKIKEFMIEHKDKENVVFIEGYEDSDFIFNSEQLVDFEDFKEVYNSFVPYFLFQYKNKKVMCSHAGLSNIPKDIRILNKSVFVNGFGYKDTELDSVFRKNNSTDYIQLYAGRGSFDSNFKDSLSFNNNLLEGGDLISLKIKDEFIFKRTANVKPSEHFLRLKYENIFNKYSGSNLVDVDNLKSLNKYRELSIKVDDQNKYHILKDTIVYSEKLNSNKESEFYFEKYNKIFGAYSKTNNEFVFIDNNGYNVYVDKELVNSDLLSLMKEESVYCIFLLSEDGVLYAKEAFRQDKERNKVKKKYFKEHIKSVKFKDNKSKKNFIKNMKNINKNIYEL